MRPTNNDLAIACFLVIGAMTVAGCSRPTIIPPPSGNTLFRDDFDGTLKEGWTVDAANGADVDLAARAGFARVLRPESPDPAIQTSMTLLLRENTGDFVLLTRLEFQTTMDLQLSGLVVRGDDGRTVAFGLFSATGTRGNLRGLLLRADRGPDVAPGRAIAQSDLADVYLRLERTGNRYTGSYSADGASFTVVGTLTDDLSDHVGAGIGTAADRRCKVNCDQRVPADFDFFEARAPASSQGD